MTIRACEAVCQSAREGTQLARDPGLRLEVQKWREERTTTTTATAASYGVESTRNWEKSGSAIGSGFGADGYSLDCLEITATRRRMKYYSQRRSEMRVKKSRRLVLLSGLSCSGKKALEPGSIICRQTDWTQTTRYLCLGRSPSEGARDRSGMEEEGT